VESSFKHDAVSRFGAVGLWQFMRHTGQEYMTIDDVLDERRDPIRATHAAAHFLLENYLELESWPMAITAYNHGTEGMLRAKKLKGDFEVVFKKYRGRHFGFASRNFYSEFLAARDVAKNHRRYFGELVFNKPIRYRAIILEGYGSLKELADYLEVDLSMIRKLNPALRKTVFSGKKYVPKGYALRLPPRSDRIISGDPARIPKSLYKTQQKRSLFYLVRKGDTAAKIAQMHRVNLSDLIMANRLDSRATIYAGQNLRLPVSD
jgi:membrane-bound lytic murein transglycosylase D